MKIENEFVHPCVICGKRWQRKDVGKWVYHESQGVLCLKHKGVEEWYNRLLAGIARDIRPFEAETGKSKEKK